MKDPFDVFLEEDDDSEDIDTVFSYIPEIDIDTDLDDEFGYQDMDDEKEDIDF